MNNQMRESDSCEFHLIPPRLLFGLPAVQAEQAPPRARTFRTRRVELVGDRFDLQSSYLLIPLPKLDDVHELRWKHKPRLRRIARAEWRCVQRPQIHRYQAERPANLIWIIRLDEDTESQLCRRTAV